MTRLKPTQLKRITLVVSFVTICFVTPLTNAETWLEDFYNQAGAGMNVTGPGAYESQSGGIITGGGLSVRIPPKNIQLYNFNPPNLKMGCGGIDLWAGSFGFINKAQFVAFLRNIGQNSLGFFFELALKTMAPEIHGVIKGLQDVAQKMNNNSLNACETTKRMFSGIESTKEAGSFTERMQSFSTALGTIGDNITAIDTYAPNLTQVFEDLKNVKATTPAAIVNSGGEDHTPVGDYNVVYRALTASGPSVFTMDEINLIMSLTGTIIVRTPTTAAPKDVIIDQYIAPTVTNITEFIGHTGVESSFAMNICNDNTDCLAPTVAASGTRQFKSFAMISQEKITSMRDKIRDAVIQDPAVINYLSQSSVPIYRLLATTARPGREKISDNIINQYSDAVAIDMTSVFVKNLMDEVARKAKTLTPSSPSEKAHLDTLMTTLKNVSDQADQLLNKKQLQLAQLSYQVTTIEQYERAMFKGMSDQQLAALNLRR